jgi:hypothetical protein
MAGRFGIIHEDEARQFQGLKTSPGGFCFGLENFTWPEPVPCAITWYLDGTASVFDQFGRPIKGFVTSDGREVLLADRPPEHQQATLKIRRTEKFCTHLQAVQALEAEEVDWRTLPSSGWPQLPIELLRSLPNLPDPPLDQLHGIKSESLRKASLLRRLEMDTETAARRAREEAQAESEYREALARAQATAAQLSANGARAPAATVPDVVTAPEKPEHPEADPGAVSTTERPVEGKCGEAMAIPETDVPSPTFLAVTNETTDPATNGTDVAADAGEERARKPKGWRYKDQ